MILVAREPSAFPCAAVAPAPDGWIVWRFAAQRGPTFLVPLLRVAKDDGPRGGFDVACQIALREELPPVDGWGRA